MKKILILVALALMFAPLGAVAADLNGKAGIQMSNQVSGTYFTEATGETQYTLSTGHAQGNTVYATSSADSKIYKKASSDPFVSGDLLNAHNVALASGNTWTAL